MKNSYKKKKKAPKNPWLLEGSENVPLVPKHIFYPLIFISLALPNLIYSGLSFFDTLHILKWVWTMTPVALLSLAGGIILTIYGAKHTDFRVDIFMCAWFGMAVFITLQPLWVDIFARSTYIKEWFFFLTLFGAYVLCYNLFTSELALRCVMWLANINAAVNIVFAELLIRDMNGIFPFIMNVPGNYIGNTGQQEMFGLWMAMAVMNGIFLNIVYTQKARDESSKAWKAAKYGNIFLLAFDSWGLWNSTTRAGVLALLTGTVILCVIIWNCKPHKMLKSVGVAISVVFFVLALNLCTGYFGWSRAYIFLNKTMDMLMNTTNFGKRREIWMTSWNIYKMHPISGVGLGHYKWYYLRGQHNTMLAHPDIKWQFTYWAHSEYLQWLAEFGIFGGIFLLAAAVWWIWSFIRAMNLKKDLSFAEMWGSAFVFLIWFDALFSRPFHRIENVIWLSLAFALSNRALLPAPFNARELRHAWGVRAFGVFMLAASVAGMAFLYSGCVGNRNLREYTKTRIAAVQRRYIDLAAKSLMERDEANEELALHLLNYAKATKKQEDFDVAVSRLLDTFRTRPTGSKLVMVHSIAQQTGNRELAEAIAPYMPPDPAALYRRVVSRDTEENAEKKAQ